MNMHEQLKMPKQKI